MSVFPIACDRESKAEAPDTPERLSIKDPLPKGQQKQKGIYLNMNLIFKYELLCMCKSNLPCHTYSPLVLVKEKHSFHHDYRQTEYECEWQHHPGEAGVQVPSQLCAPYNPVSDRRCSDLCQVIDIPDFFSKDLEKRAKAVAACRELCGTGHVVY